MRTGSRWLLAGVLGASLVASGSAYAQDTVNPGTPVVGPSSATPLGTFRPPAPIRPGQPISVLVFPFGIAGGAAPETAAPAVEPNAAVPSGAEAEAASQLTPEQQAAVNRLTAAVKSGLLSTPSYNVASYHPQSSLIQRGRRDDILKPEHLADLISPATGSVDPEKAKTVAYRLGIQSYLAGTLDLKVDPAANTAEVTVEAQLVDSSNGQVLRSAAVTGAAAGAAGVPAQLVVDRAVMDAAMKTIPALGIELRPLPPSGQAPDSGKSPKASNDGGSKSAKQTREEREAARKAERDGKKAQEESRKQAELAKREQARAEKARLEAERKDKKDSEKQDKREPSSRGRSGGVKQAALPAPAAVQEDARVLTAQAQPAPSTEPAQPVQAAQPAPIAQPQPVVGGPATVETAPGIQPGTSNAEGQPVPYGYAIGEAKTAIPERNRTNLRIPPWLGLAAFLAGVSFLL